MKVIFNKNGKLEGMIAQAIGVIYKYFPKNKIIRDRCIKELIWSATADSIKNKDGIKYIGQDYWTKKAIEQCCKNIRSNKKQCTPYKHLRHEHAVPRKDIKKYLDALGNRTTNKEIKKLLNKYAYTVIIQKDEHVKLSEKEINEEQEPFSRYTQSKIIVYNIGNTELRSLKGFKVFANRGNDVDVEEIHCIKKFDPSYKIFSLTTTK